MTLIRGSRVALGLVIIAVIGKGLGFLRESVTAWAFGADWETDAFITAMAIHALVYAIPNNIVSNAAMPVIKGALAQSPAKGNSAFLSIGAVATFLSTLGALVLVWLAPEITNLVVPGFAPETKLATVSMVRWGAISIPLTCAISLIRVFLNATGDFHTPAYSGLVFNIASIALLLVTSRITASGLMWSFVLAQVLQLAWHIPVTRRRLTSSRGGLSVAGLNQIASMALAITLSTVLFQVAAIVEGFLASFLVEGSLSSLRYANKLYLLPLNVFVVTLVQWAFPRLSETAGHDGSSFGEELRRITALVLGGVAPMAVLIVGLRIPIVQFLLQRGAFTHNDTLQTAAALGIFGLGLIAASLREVAQVACFSLRDARTPTRSSMVMLTVSIGISFLVVDRLGHLGLALASVVGWFVASGLLFYHLRAYFMTSHAVGNLWRWAGALVVMVVVFAVSGELVIRAGFGHAPMVQLLVQGTLSLVSYLISVVVLGVPVLTDVVRGSIGIITGHRNP